MSENNGSARAIIDIGRGGRKRTGSKYNHQDQLLVGFYSNPGCTAKEIAAEVFDWKYERYADSPKRAFDLASKKLGYLFLLGNRECRRSGKDAHIYKITERGIEYLMRNRLIENVTIAARVDPVQPVADKRVSLSDLKSMLL